MNKIEFIDSIPFIVRNDRKFIIATFLFKKIGYSRNASDTVRSLGLKLGIDYHSFPKKHNVELFKELNNLSMVGLRSSYLLFLTEEGLRSCCKRSKKIIPPLIYSDFLGISDNEYNYQRKFREHEFCILINKAYPNVFTMQYRVGSFFLDMYSDKLKLAIEIDENGHDYRQQKDEKRENKIRESIPDIEFIRAKIDDKSFNLGDLIFKINSKLYGNG